MLLFCLLKNTAEKLEQGRMAVQAIYYPSITYGRSTNKITWASFATFLQYTHGESGRNAESSRRGSLSGDTVDALDVIAAY